MNDNMEHFWLRNLAQQYFDELKAKPDHSAKCATLRSLFGSEDRGHIYCTSFSEKGDDLSQWRAYAADGAGLSIGFKTKALLGRTRVEMRKVLYQKEEQRKLLETIIHDYDEVSNLGGEPRRTQALAAGFFLLNLWHHAARCKNPAFEREEEWRLIYQPEFDYAEAGLTFPREPEPLKFRTVGDALIPYFEFRFDVPLAEIIDHVWVGPRAATTDQMEAIRYLLDSKGLTSAVLRISDASYRRSSVN
jgi:hypothetical protein